MLHCAQEEPVLQDIEGRLVACHLYDREAHRAPVEIATGVSPVS